MPEYLGVLIAVILGLSLTHLLRGLSKLIHMRRTINRLQTAQFRNLEAPKTLLQSGHCKSCLGVVGARIHCASWKR
jgi:hypothetical protein